MKTDQTGGDTPVRVDNVVCSKCEGEYESETVSLRCGMVTVTWCSSGHVCIVNSSAVLFEGEFNNASDRFRQTYGQPEWDGDGWEQDYV